MCVCVCGGGCCRVAVCVCVGVGGCCRLQCFLAFYRLLSVFVVVVVLFSSCRFESVVRMLLFPDLAWGGEGGSGGWGGGR